MNEQEIKIKLVARNQLEGASKLEVFKKYGMVMQNTDFSILCGAREKGNHYTSSSNGEKGVYIVVKNDGPLYGCDQRERAISVCPTFSYNNISEISDKIYAGNDGTSEIEFGEYPQTAVEKEKNKKLEKMYSKKAIKKTGKSYTIDSRGYTEYDKEFSPESVDEYEFDGKRYVRMISKPNLHDTGQKKLINGLSLSKIFRQPVWVEVEPIRWLIDEKTKTAVSKKGIFSGVRFKDLQKFIDNVFSKEMEAKKPIEEKVIPKNDERKGNPYNFDFKKVSEEEIIRGSLLSKVSVFLHGQSGDGKSSRVKRLDPDLEIVYLRNATPESLNGKSVYNSETGEMIDIPPTWFKRLNEKCEKEPDKIHILFFDEITNALPSIQGMAYNIILDREVNGIWKLPDNVRIVAAGNDYNESLAANQLAEPLFNRFAHSYIKTGVEDFLKWAITPDEQYEKLNYEKKSGEEKIHPAIYAYIAFKGESALRSAYTGIKPNADPRKWEMASRLLYTTGQPEMLRGLVGEEITRDFVNFCNQKVITVQDVLDKKYDLNGFEMTTDEKWATVVSLSNVKEDNFMPVREFVSTMEPELVAVFDSLWVRGDETRIERLAEIRLAAQEKKQEINAEGGMSK